MRNRCLILIDGSNFYFKLKDLKLHNLLGFDFFAFAQHLARTGSIIDCRYYVGKVRQDGTKKADSMLADQQKLFASLKRHKYHYELGYLLKTKNIYHEKGVDVHIAVDMLEATYEDICDRIILVSSDTDLALAIKKARQKGKIVEYIGFSHQPSIAMVRFCSESRLLTIEDIKQFTKTPH